MDKERRQKLYGYRCNNRYGPYNSCCPQTRSVWGIKNQRFFNATSTGLGTCWIGAFDADAAKEILKLPEGVEPVVFTPLGYPADEAGTKERKDLSELVRYEQW
ncbi:MAG: nitroreductase family protein [Methanobacterium sp.]